MLRVAGGNPGPPALSDNPYLITYLRSVLGSTVEDVSGQRILGTLLNYHNDNLVFDFTNTAFLAKRVEPTKTNVISRASKMYDSLGIISPITFQFKILFQELCKDKEDWEEPLEGSCKSIWQRMVTQLQGVKPLTLPQCLYACTEGEVIASELHGAVVFLRIVTTCASFIRIFTSKTRVAPLSEQTIPRLELLSAVVLSRLTHSIKKALSSEMRIDKLLCWTDSKIAWYWIVQSQNEWKPFVQHRVD